MITAFFTLIGATAVRYEKARLDFCDKMLCIAENISILLNSTAPETSEMFKKLSCTEKLKGIDFDNVCSFSPLTDGENEIINEYISSVGKYDIQTQIKCASEFAAAMGSIQKKYRQGYEKNKKLYIAFGLSAGIVISVLLI